jgi:hypothetical protein
MAGLLDYYNQNPELFAENEYLLAKDPAYDLGLMNLGAMSFKERFGGYQPKGSKVLGLFGLKPEYRTLSRTLGSYLHEDVQPQDIQRRYTEAGIEPGDISLFTGPFTKGDTATYWTDPKIVPPSERWNEPVTNVDKARVIAHENRHKLTEENPELYNLQPNWTALNVQSDDPDAEQSLLQKIFGWPSTSERRAAKKQYWRNEAFNRFMDLRNFPDIKFRGMSATHYPRGLGAVDLRPEDMYFDKIWRDKWEPHAKAYDEKLKEIAARRNVPGTPIVPMDRGRGRDDGGYQPPSRAQNVARTSSRVGPGGNVRAYGLAHGGLIDLYRYGGFI